MLAAILVSSALVLAPAARPGNAIRIPLEEPASAAELSSPGRASTAAHPATISSLGNVRVNDPTQLPAPAADVTPAIAVNGNQVLVVWRVLGPLVTQRLRAAYSEDGGISFTDAGWLPNFATWRWGVDPCVEADPIDGTFMIAAQVTDPGIPATGIGILTARVGGGITWGPGSVTNATGYLGVLWGDQLQSTFDATNRTWHLAFHDGYTSPQALIHRYSADHGATWFGPDSVVSDVNGYAGIAPRIAYMTDRGPLITHLSTPTGSFWDPSTIKSSTFLWPGFQPAVTVSTHRVDASSLPGSRDGTTTQTLAVDRTTHMFSSRAYLAWIQSATLTWPAAAPVLLTELEPNDTPGTANGIGGAAGYLDGSLSSGSDADVFSVSLLTGEHLVLTIWTMQSLGISANCRTEIIAPDGTHTLGMTGFLPGDAGVGKALFTAPRSATYFVRVTGFQVGSYMFALARTNQVASPVRDRRELMTSFSGDLGDSWSPAVTIPMGGAGFDLATPAMVVANDGRPYLFWLDYSKTDPDGAIATLEVTRSTDGGETWESSRTISSVPSDWQPVTVTAGSNMKMGYRIDAATTPIALPQGPKAPPILAAAPSPTDDVHVAWVDARDGESNIYSARFATGFDVPLQYADTFAVPGQTVQLRMILRNRNSLFPEQVTPMFVQLGRNWAHSYLAPFTVGVSSTSVVYPFSVQVPDTAAPGSVSYLGAILAGSEVVGGCTPVIEVHSPVGVDPPRLALSFDPPAPNPVRNRVDFRFTLPSESAVALEIYDVAGARVRSVVSGSVPEGMQARTWDLRDDSGQKVAAGLYFSQLTVGAWKQTRRVVVLP